MYVGTERISFLEKDFIMSNSYMVWQLVEELNSGIHHTFLKRSALHYHTCRFFFSFIVIINVTFFSSDSVLLTWQRLKFRSYGGPTHRNVMSPRIVRWRHVTTVHAESHSRAPRPIQITRPFKPVLSFQRCLVNSLLQSARLKLLVFLMLTYHLSYV